jgi:hypothetical protein
MLKVQVTLYLNYDQVKNTLSRIELLKAANTNVCSCLPSWADDDYFRNLYIPKTMKGTDLETNMKTRNSIQKKETIDKLSTESERTRPKEEADTKDLKRLTP